MNCEEKIRLKESQEGTPHAAKNKQRKTRRKRRSDISRITTTERKYAYLFLPLPFAPSRSSVNITN